MTHIELDIIILTNTPGNNLSQKNCENSSLARLRIYVKTTKSMRKIVLLRVHVYHCVANWSATPHKLFCTPFFRTIKGSHIHELRIVKGQPETCRKNTRFWWLMGHLGQCSGSKLIFNHQISQGISRDMLPVLCSIHKPRFPQA